MKEIVKSLKRELELKGLGEIKIFRNPNWKKTTDAYTLSQKSKIEELAKNVNLENAKPCRTPMEPGFNKLEDDDNLLPNNNK